MINIKENNELNTLNHSCAHLLAQAVKHLYKDAKFWVGPVIDDGFYYDIDLGNEVIKEEDLEKIEKEMKKISKDGKYVYDFGQNDGGQHFYDNIQKYVDECLKKGTKLSAEDNEKYQRMEDELSSVEEMLEKMTALENREASLF